MQQLIRLLCNNALLFGFITLSAMDNQNLPVQWGLSCRQGKRLAMEDFCLDSVQRTDVADSVFALFDGHNGYEAAKIAKENLIPLLNKNSVTFFNRKSYVYSTVVQSCIDMEEAIVNRTETSGTTAVIAVCSPSGLKFAWIGDSRAILVRDGKIIFRTLDHNPARKPEKKRITSCNGTITTDKGIRVNGLKVSRVFGDNVLKIKSPGAIIAQPDFHNEKIKANDLLIMMTDGVSCSLTNKMVVEIVQKSLSKTEEQLKSEYNTIETREYREERGSSTYFALLARSLRDEAYKNGSSDNISVIVARLK